MLTAVNSYIVIYINKTFLGYAYNLQLEQRSFGKMRTNNSPKISSLFALLLTNNETSQLLTWKSFLHSAIMWASPWVAARFSFKSLWSGLPKLCFLCITLGRRNKEEKDSNIYTFANQCVSRGNPQRRKEPFHGSLSVINWFKRALLWSLEFLSFIDNTQKNMKETVFNEI